MGNLKWKNRDYLKRLNYPRQPYAFSGVDWADANEGADKTRQKLVINGAPMYVGSMTPGSLARTDELWQQTYGASLDSIMAIFDGEQIVDGWISSGSVFGSTAVNQGVPNNNELNIYEILDGRQQVQFVAHSDTVDEARTSDNFVFMSRVRSLCVRGPMHMAGWGKTITMRPTDPEPANKRLNDVEHKLDRSTWKVGPVDIRWDDRRQVWRAFNDLIVDDYGNGLGTFVHSTNPDEGCGFPFLRGRIEDVWAVRKTEPGAPTGKDNDTDQSATVCTRSDSLIFQDSNDLVAPLDDILIVFDECFGPFSATCGAETTKFAQLGLKIFTNFYANPSQVGPLGFSLTPPDDNVALGQLYYQGDGPCGAWVPGVAVDICEIGGTQLNGLYTNDKNIGDGAIQIGKSLEHTQDTVFELLRFAEDTAEDDKDFAGDSVKPAFEKIEAWTDNVRAEIQVEIAKAVYNAYTQLATQAEAAIQQGYNDLLAKMNSTIQTIIIELASQCECDIQVPLIEGVPPRLQTAGLGLPDITTDLDLQPEISAAEKYFNLNANRQVEVDNEDDKFQNGHPSPVTIQGDKVCPPADSFSDTVFLYGV